MAKKTKVKAPPVEEIEDDEEELDELAEDEEVEETPAKRKGGTPEVEFGVADLCAYVKEKTGKEYSTRDMRTLLRKMARDNGRIDREVIAGNRARYNWPGGPKNAEVKVIIAAVKGGEIEASRKEALDALKERKAAKDAAAGVSKKSKKSAKKAKAAPVVEDDDDLDEVDFEDDDE